MAARSGPGRGRRDLAPSRGGPGDGDAGGAGRAPGQRGEQPGGGLVSAPLLRLERVTCLRRPGPAVLRPESAGGQPEPSAGPLPRRVARRDGGAGSSCAGGEARRGSSTPGPGRSSHRVCCAGGGIERNQSQARPGQAVSGQRRGRDPGCGPCPRGLRSARAHAPGGVGSGRRSTAGAAAGPDASRNGGRPEPARPRRPGPVSGYPGPRRGPDAARHHGPPEADRRGCGGPDAPEDWAGRWVRPGEAEARRRAGTMASGRNRPPRWGPLTAPPLAPARHPMTRRRSSMGVVSAQAAEAVISSRVAEAAPPPGRARAPAPAPGSRRLADPPADHPAEDRRPAARTADRQPGTPWRRRGAGPAVRPGPAGYRLSGGQRTAVAGQRWSWLGGAVGPDGPPVPAPQFPPDAAAGGGRGHAGPRRRGRGRAEDAPRQRPGPRAAHSGPAGRLRPASTSSRSR